MAKKSTIVFIIFALLWQIAVGILYGFFFAYNETQLIDMQSGTWLYKFIDTDSRIIDYIANTTQHPFPFMVVVIAIVLLIVGLALIAGYIQGQSVTGMSFTLLIFALTVQNFFIFDHFCTKIVFKDHHVASNSQGQRQYNNDLITGDKIHSASFLDAVGAALAIYAGYSAVIGRIGLGEVFFLTWIGTFLYSLNSHLLWMLFIPDNGYASRAFAFGSSLGLVSSLILGQKQMTKDNINYKSSYRHMALSFLGVVFLWCSYPIIVLSSVYTSTGGKIVAMASQVNIWLALAASVLGCYSASCLAHRKFSVHDMVFGSITGAIAYSSSCDINFNPGASTSMGFFVAFLCTGLSNKFKTKMNAEGVVDSNSSLFQFLIPSFFACIFSFLLQGVDNSKASSTTYRTVLNPFFSNLTANSSLWIVNSTTATYQGIKQASRSPLIQGAFQIAGQFISIGIGAIAGLIIGLLYKCLDSIEDKRLFFNDYNVFGPIQQVKMRNQNNQQKYRQTSQLPVDSAQYFPQRSPTKPTI